MKQLLTFILVASGIIANAQSATLTPGTAAPVFALKNVDGKLVSFSTMALSKGYIVVFTCNTCPYAKAYEQRIIDLNAKYASMGFPVIAINPNDPEVSKGDSFESMVERSKEKKYSFPYLYDDGQKATNDYGAKNTPHIFLVKHSGDENIIIYTGSIDNDPENNKADKINYLENAIAATIDGKTPEIATTKAIGCTVKRKK